MCELQFDRGKCQMCTICTYIMSQGMNTSMQTIKTYIWIINLDLPFVKWI